MVSLGPNESRKPWQCGLSAVLHENLSGSHSGHWTSDVPAPRMSMNKTPHSLVRWAPFPITCIVSLKLEDGTLSAMGFHWPFWMMSSMWQRWDKIIGSYRNLEVNMTIFPVSTVSTGGIAPLGAKPSADTVLSKLRSHIYVRTVLQKLERH